MFRTTAAAILRRLTRQICLIRGGRTPNAEIALVADYGAKDTSHYSWLE